jgi:hypothetical protein
MPITLDGTNGITTPMYNGSITANAVTPSVNMKNRIINGAMVIDQRNAGASQSIASGGATYTLDRYRVSNQTDGALTTQQVSTAPTGFNNSAKVTITTADSSLSSGQFLYFAQWVEGFNFADCGWGTANAKTVTLSFWVQSSLTGTFGGAITNENVDRSYPFTYTISSANTWELKSVTIAGDTTGTWIGATNGIGVRVLFGLGAGSGVSGTAGSWSGSGFFSATGAVSVIGTNAATWFVTGVQLEVGSTATSFDYRPYGTELALCQRYYYKLAIGQGNSRVLSGYISSTTQSINLLNMPVSMRTSPTALETSGTAAHYSVAHTNTETTCSAVPSYNDASINTVSVIGTVASGLTAGQGGQLRFINASAYLAVSAEL